MSEIYKRKERSVIVHECLLEYCTSILCTISPATHKRINPKKLCYLLYSYCICIQLYSTVYWFVLTHCLDALLGDLELYIEQLKLIINVWWVHRSNHSYVWINCDWYCAGSWDCIFYCNLNKLHVYLMSCFAPNMNQTVLNLISAQFKRSIIQNYQ